MRSIWRARPHLATLLLLLLCLGCAPCAGAKVLTVAVTLPDMVPIVKAIGGTQVDPLCVSPGGSDPHSFTLSANAAEMLRKADLIVFADTASEEFEAHIREVSGATPYVDLPDYQREGARLNDVPGLPQNPHGLWLSLTNAVAISRAVGLKLQALGADADMVQCNVTQFAVEVDALRRAGLALARANEAEGRTWVPVVPGIADAVLNLNMHVGLVLLPTEGASFAEGRAVEETVARLKSGEWAGLVCPLSAKDAKPGEIARQLARDSGSRVVYVRFLEPENTSFLAQSYYNAAVLASPRPGDAPVALTARREVPGQALLMLAVGLLLLLVLALSVALARSRRATLTSVPGAGIFDDVEPPTGEEGPEHGRHCSH